MARVRSKDTKAELVVRRLVHRLGYRFRLHRKSLPGTPDLVFPSRKRVIFVHGCFWHRHPDPKCKLARMPKSRIDFWELKLSANRDRDLKHQKELHRLGWKFMVVWECQLANMGELNKNIEAFLEGE